MTSSSAVFGDENPGTDCGTGPSRETWSLGGTPGGELACFPNPDADTRVTFLWADESLHVLAKADAVGADYPEMYTWWTTAGPNP